MRSLAVVAWAALVAAQAGAVEPSTDKREAPAMTRPVVFVCEHGNVKSLIASEWFNRLASRRGVAIRATSRGVKPEASVPAPIAAHLRADGFDVSAFHPRAFAPGDLDAPRVVMIGAAAPSFAAGAARVDKWEGVPPAGEDYGASRDALRERIEKLLDDLARRGAKP